MMKQIRKTDIIWLLAFVAGLAMMTYKCRYGMANIDESFYLTIPYRMAQGDVLFVQEWNPSQLSAIFLYPFVKLFLMINGSTEGMIIAFRYLYTAVHAAAAVFVYLKLRKVNYGAVAVSLIYLLFAPYGIMALSYNSLSLSFMLIAAILIYCNEQQRAADYFFAGLCYAGAVLCCPYLVLPYFAFALLCLGLRLAKRNWEPALKLWRAFIIFTVPCVLGGAALLAYALSQASVSQLQDGIYYLFNEPGHVTKTLPILISRFVRPIAFSNELSIYVFFAAAALALVILLDRNRDKRRGLYYIGAVLLTAVYTIPFVTNFRFINFLGFPLAFMGFFCFWLDRKRYLREMLIFWIPGMVFAFCMTWASNQNFFAMSIAAMLSSLGSIMMMVSFCRSGWEEMEKKSLFKNLEKLTACLLAVFVLFVARQRYDSLFWENASGIADMTEEISFGAEKGIYTSWQNYGTYKSFYENTRIAREHPGTKVLYLTDRPWLYLDDAKENASYSAWGAALTEETSDRLLEYYKLNPHKIPDVVYCSKQDWNGELSLPEFLRQRGYTTVEEGEAVFMLAP